MDDALGIPYFITRRLGSSTNNEFRAKKIDTLSYTLTASVVMTYFCHFCLQKHMTVDI